MFRISCFDCKSTKNLRAIHNKRQVILIVYLVVSTAKVQKIWEQFTTLLYPLYTEYCCFDCKSTKNLRAIHNRRLWRSEGQPVVSTAKVQKIWEQFTTLLKKLSRSASLFRLQKYKKFESNSQPWNNRTFVFVSCFDCKSTKNLRAIHNHIIRLSVITSVVSTAKVQKIWEQFTTVRHQFNSSKSCFDCKSTKNLRAIHNTSNLITFSFLLFRLQKYKKFESNSQQRGSEYFIWNVVSTAKVQKIWEQFTTLKTFNGHIGMLFRLQKYKKFESNSQQDSPHAEQQRSCFDCKSTKNLRAIHNVLLCSLNFVRVVSTAKVQKIWEQFTTQYRRESSPVMLFRLQKYKKFESNSQLNSLGYIFGYCCFDCKSTKNLRAIHNKSSCNSVSQRLFRLQKYKKFESNSQLPMPSPAYTSSCFDCKSTKNLRAIHN